MSARPRHPRRTRLVLPLLLMLCALPALAHRALSARKAVATARLDGEAARLDVMVWLRLAGERATAFRARYDIDRSGALDAAESALLGDALAPEAIGGLVVRQDGAARKPASAEAKARLVPDGAIEVAVLITWPLEAAADGAFPIELAARAGRDRRGAPVILAELAALPPLRLDPKPAAGVLGPAPLVPGAAGLTARIVRAEAP